MSNTKLLTIVIPTYNRYLELEETLSCLIKQLKKYQLYDKTSFIIADNASDNPTPDSLNRLISNNGYTYYKNDKNIGITKNILNAFQLVSSKYVWFYGDDDFVDDVLIAKLGDILEQDVDYIQVNRLSFSASHHIIYHKPNENIIIQPISLSEPALYDIDKDSGFITSNIIKANVFQVAIDIIRLNTSQTFLTNNYFIKAANFVSILNSTQCLRIESKLVFQRVTTGSHFHKTPELIFKTFFKDQFEIIDFLKGFNPIFSNLKVAYQKTNLTNLLVLRLFHKNSKEIGKEILSMYDRPNIYIYLICTCPQITLYKVYKVYKFFKRTPYPIHFDKFN